MKLHPLSLSLLVVAFGAAAADEERLLRGLSATRPDPNSKGRRLPGSSTMSGGNDCTIGGIAYLHPNPGHGSDRHEEELGCLDEGGVLTPLDLDAMQTESVLSMAASGTLIFGESKVTIGAAIQSASTGHIMVAPDQKIEVVKGADASPAGQGGPVSFTSSTGDRYFMLFRVTDSTGSANPDGAAVISDNFFGSMGDQINFKSQMSAVSNGQYTVLSGVRPGFDVSAILAALGVIEIEIDVPHGMGDSGPLIAAAKAKLNAHFGDSSQLTAYMDHAVFVLPNLYDFPGFPGWAAYAGVNSYYQVYHNEYYGFPAVAMHEHGHNMGFAHSGGLDGQTYTDHTCQMGNPLWADDDGMMCFNAAKNWQIQFYNGPQQPTTWYDDDAFVEHDVDTNGPRSLLMIGVGEYDQQTTPRSPIALKMEAGGESVYVGFNSAAGANSQNVEADNEVTVYTKAGNYYAVSSLKTHLVQGQTYNHQGQGELIVSAQCINTSITPSVACVCVFKTGQECPPCICHHGPQPPTPPPTPAPPTAPPTPWVGSGTTTQFKVEVMTDNYPGETTWEMVNGCNPASTGREGGPYLTTGTLESDTFVLDTAKYTFTIKDSYGDGICCSYGLGWYKVTADEGTIVSECVGEECGFSSLSETFGSCDSPPPPAPPPTIPPISPPTLPPVAPTLPPVAPTTPPFSPPAPPPPAPTPPTGGDPGPADPAVINIDLTVTMRFTFTPQPWPACVSAAGAASGSSLQECARACAFLATCAGFDALDDPADGACVLHMGGSSECDEPFDSNAVHYERAAEAVQVFD